MFVETLNYCNQIDLHHFEWKSQKLEEIEDLISKLIVEECHVDDAQHVVDVHHC
jgi:hypothetical protein